MRLHGGAAEGAAGVGMEPHVDAVDVEAMGAPRKNAHLLALLEVAKAHCAVHRFLLGAVECEQGEGLDDGGIESAGGGRGQSTTGTVKGEDEASPDTAVTLAEEEEARAKVEVEAEEEEDGREEDDGGDEHNLAAEGVASGARDLVGDVVGIHSASSLSRRMQSLSPTSLLYPDAVLDKRWILLGHKQK